jgi:hypothetical protein
MKKSHLLAAVCAVVFSFITTSSHAVLMSRLDGAAAYDDVLDILWTTDAGLSGQGTWYEHLDWIDSLNAANYLGFNDWRLASMSVSAGLPTGLNNSFSVVDCSSATHAECKDNELGYMFYYNLDGMLYSNRTGTQNVDGVTLADIQPIYWSGTESSSNNAWAFIFSNGFQDFDWPKDVSYWDGPTGPMYGWAVRDGDVAVPEPTTLALLSLGLVGLGFTRRRMKA